MLWDEKDPPPYVPLMTLSEWKRKLREVLPRRDAKLILEIYENYTIISPVWINKLPEEKKRRINELTKLCLKKGLLRYYCFSLSEGATFPIKKNNNRKENRK